MQPTERRRGPCSGCRLDRLQAGRPRSAAMSAAISAPRESGRSTRERPRLHPASSAPSALLASPIGRAIWRESPDLTRGCAVLISPRRPVRAYCPPLPAVSGISTRNFMLGLSTIAQRFFGSANERKLRPMASIVKEINALEESFKSKTNEELRALTPAFKDRLAKGETLEDILPEAFAAVREAAKRTLGQRHFDVQLVGGLVLHQGCIAEM